MKVKDIMLSDPPTLRHTATYEEVASLLESHNLPGAPILDDTDSLVGIITEKDLFAVLYPFASSYTRNPNKYGDPEAREQKIVEISQDPITKFMPKILIKTHPDTPVLRIGAIMLSRGLHAVPVLDDEERLVGVLFRADIYRRLSNRYLNP